MSGGEPWSLTGPRYSPNLAKWARREAKRRSPRVFRDTDGTRLIGSLDDDGWFIGTKLFRVLGVGLKATSYAYPPRDAPMVEEADFWPRYAAIGRCAIDEQHKTSFVGDETRWETGVDFRRCLWCGEHEQRLHRWTETVDRKAWRPAEAVSA